MIKSYLLKSFFRKIRKENQSGGYKRRKNKIEVWIEKTHWYITPYFMFCLIYRCLRILAQIDLLIDRDDNVINICEMKFYNTEFAIDKNYAAEIAKKVNAFCSGTKTKKSVFVTFITTYGLVQNQYARQYVQNELTMDQLFVKL